MEYNFYSWKTATIRPINNTYPSIHSPRDLYDALSEIWCAETCAPRMRDRWTDDNKTLGQCSITASIRKYGYSNAAEMQVLQNEKQLQWLSLVRKV